MPQPQTKASKEADKALEEIKVTVKLPKPLHAKMVQIAAAESKPLAQKVVQAVREHAAGYERTSKTVTTLTRKKTAK